MQKSNDGESAGAGASSSTDREIEEVEHRLFELESRWGEFFRGARTGLRKVSGTMTPLEERLVDVHTQLEAYRRRFVDERESIALVEALACCCDRNVPLPDWLATQVSRRVSITLAEPVSLHEAFELGRELPVQGKKADNARKQYRHQLRLWYTVRVYQTACGLSYSKALRKALDDGGFPFGRTTADRLFKAQDRVNRIHGHAMAERPSVHRLR